MGLTEIDSLEIAVIVDNELDPLSPSCNPAVKLGGGLKDPSEGAIIDRGGRAKEMRMDHICCGAHGLSMMITAIKGGSRHTVLFDTGPEEEVWQRNAHRIGADIAAIELIQLSHWHRDHSGGMLRAIRMINSAKSADAPPVIADLHPSRPDYRGVMGPIPISLEADPTFDEVVAAGATLVKSAAPHGVCDDMFLISGEIPRRTAYEQGIRRGIRFSAETNAWSDDPLISDERLLMVKLKGKGVVVFTGCSHAGAVNASRHAVELGDSAPLYAIVGGYHLADAERDTIDATVKDFKSLGPKILIPGHCTGWRAKCKIEQEMPGCMVPSFVGSRLAL
ncbi:beta-lactamase-like protein [Lineolata rhizophorae]|uniref:Beta-lactamase-like protein n=1 Tax=Lineolata rhizophorae TaxID=578093 RepID=A0A6A6P3K3_9PEZI|nr:beta-lactamase-like protein [Lineolata rhizophorae]